ncbi:hypothetical protein L226DRAFT_572380 [Lentinus tigrinus ALCF2SS1-7]|uniref:DUF6533 domain-containing protein n=1 Tax=Lentinus tigrinus ALCF2SS1-6 TaxID=1328759 RepID=A0A5C2S6U1_9APHY|nr:hypothetical protein L227DRAFT_612396 [Lentinus tigrinus ALCF2SS1-6]RPD73305.1 hypothetical protein L226DRAFT_572380 [Lentinus tigrinus ALCF2SS1-7]
MSSNTDADLATLEAVYHDTFVSACCVLASSVVFIYDAIVTFNREVTCFRTNRLTGASSLFLANKAISLALSVMGLVSFASFPSDKKAYFAIGSSQFVPAAAFSALRAYTLSTSKLIGLLVLTLSIAPVGANLVEYGYGLSGLNLPIFGCVATDDTTEALDRRSALHDMQWRKLIGDCLVIIISRVPLTIADILVIFITWRTLYTRDVLKHSTQPFKRLSLADILLRNGMIYFIVLTVLNIVHLTFSLVSVASNDAGASDITYFTAPVTAILVSRFILELLEAGQKVVRVDPDDPLCFSGNIYDDDETPSFIRSLGAVIEPPRTDNLESDVSSHSDGDEQYLASQAVGSVSLSSSV